MIVTGYRTTTDFFQAQLVLQKHTEFASSDIKTMIANIKEGKAVKLPDDFVLREDLEELDFLVD